MLLFLVDLTHILIVCFRIPCDLLTRYLQPSFLEFKPTKNSVFKAFIEFLTADLAHLKRTVYIALACAFLKTSGSVFHLLNMS